jgi:hypothetical protein
MHPRLPYLRNVLLTATALLSLGGAPAVAEPKGPSVVGGAVRRRSKALAAPL